MPPVVRIIAAARLWGARFWVACLLTMGGAASAAESPVAAAAQVDALLRSLPENAEARFAPAVADDLLLRRLSLDLVGVSPEVEAVRAYRDDESSDKRSRLVRRLMDDPRFGDNVARYWRDVILSRRLEDRALRVAEPLEEDLAAWVNADEGWETIARRFITATGASDKDGATAIIMAQDGRTEEITAEVSRVFLGIQIQCAQCHDHPWDSWKREQFHELAAFFSRVGAKQRRGVRPPVFDVVVNDRPDKPRFRNPNNANRRGRPEHYMADLEQPGEPGRRMQPRFFLTGFEKPIGTTDADRREAAAEELTANPWFARSLVNRVWTELVGPGFYETVDDLGPTRPAMAAPVLDSLTEGFIESGYRLKWLYETICLTEAYARESRAPDHMSGVMTATVSHPLRADVLFDSLASVLELRGKAAAGGRNGPRRRVTQVFGYDPSEPRADLASTIPQVLMLMNSPALHQATRAKRGSMLDDLLGSHRDAAGDVRHEAAITELFERVLSRRPTDAELAAATEHAARTDKPTAYEDLLWALLNTAEFTHRR